MQIYNFDDFPSGSMTHATDYGGNSCGKSQLYFNNALWMVKYPSDWTERREDSKKVLSFDTSPISEWLGSHIYESVGIPVHETILGIYRKQLVVACKHVNNADERVLTFRGLMRSWRQLGNHLKRRATDHSATFTDIFNVIDAFPEYRKLGLRERFWDMFIVDAFIGNFDRNVGNWGIIQNQKNRTIRISPVFDNAGSFFPQWTLERQHAFISQKPNAVKTLLTSGGSPFLDDNGAQIHPIRLLHNPACREYKSDLIAAVNRIVPKINIHECYKLIDMLENSALIHSTSANLYKFALSTRYEDRLNPFYERNKITEDNSISVIPDEEDSENNLSLSQ